MNNDFYEKQTFLHHKLVYSNSAEKFEELNLQLKEDKLTLEQLVKICINSYLSKDPRFTLYLYYAIDNNNKDVKLDFHDRENVFSILEIENPEI